MRLHSVILCLAVFALAGCIQQRGRAPQSAAPTPVRAALPAVASALTTKGVATCQAEIGDILAANFKGNVTISVLTPESAQGAGSIAIIPVGDTHPRITTLTYAPGAGGACDLQTTAITAIGNGCGQLPAKFMSEAQIRTLHGKDLLQGGRTPTEGVLLKDINGTQCLSLAVNGSGPVQRASLRPTTGDQATATLLRAGVSRCTAEIAGAVAGNVKGAAQIEVLTSDAAAGSGSVAFWVEGDYHPKIHLLSYFERPGSACILKMNTVAALSGACAAQPASLLQGGAITQRFGNDLMQGKAGTTRSFMFKDLDGKSCVALDFL
ncbi:MAG: hypothetical protein ACJAVR_002311 [Paracoccaceae bacterium]|jgi:hypothetical protein